jgi:hypothetical protein
LKLQRRLKTSSAQYEADLARAVTNSLKTEERLPVVNQEGLQRQVLLRTALLRNFVINKVPRDGHCLFHALARGLFSLGVVNKKPTQASLRLQLAQFLIERKGVVAPEDTEMPSYFEQREDGTIVLSGLFQQSRGHNLKETTLQQYARQLQGGLFGGDLEIYALSYLYNVVIHVYSWSSYDGFSVPVPERYGPQDARRTISLFFEQNFDSNKGDSDHWELMIDKFGKWREYMQAMPKWNVDIGLCEGPAGRGIKALRDFKEGEVLMWYDGHRVNSRGVVQVERKAVAELFRSFNLDPPLPHEFKQSHSVWVCRKHETELLIDGYPLTLPIFDNVPNIGRGALFNSASPSDSNMMMEWHPAPDLEPDLVNGLADCEGFFIARTPIKCGDKARGRGNLQQPLAQIADVMNLLAKSVTTSSPREDVNDDDVVFKKTESAKRALCVVEPNADLERYLTQHGIMKWWPDIYDKLGITSIEDLRFIGKVECERYLAGLPALPIMRLAWLADSKPSITDSTKATI